MKIDAPTTQTTIILDNGGGITIQIQQTTGDTGRSYQHTYWDAAAAAADLKAVMSPKCDIADWDGNEIDDNGWLEPTHDEQRNGGYRVYDINEFLAAAPDDVWGNAGQTLRCMTYRPILAAAEIILID